MVSSRMQRSLMRRELHDLGSRFDFATMTKLLCKRGHK